MILFAKNDLRKICLIWFFLFGIYSCSSSKQKIPFESKKWLEGDKYLRGRMVDDLKSSNILIDKTKNEVIEILGKPNDSLNNNYIYSVSFSEISDNTLGYSKLSIAFDLKNKVEKTAVYD